MDLEQQFAMRVRQAIREAKGLGYDPRRFESMLASYGAVETAKKLVASGELQDGIKTLARLNRLDLSIESIMLEEGFAPLFTKSEREAASWRMSQL